ncbi:hypothetical protein EDC01DRAFT_781957 [Geopyxis carbonaria]|nr:hypothetical protein EDC01DRAFT_781957 [Geopyxis carbonaria]
MPNIIAEWYFLWGFLALSVLVIFVCGIINMVTERLSSTPTIDHDREIKNCCRLDGGETYVDLEKWDEFELSDEIYGEENELSDGYESV